MSGVQSSDNNKDAKPDQNTYLMSVYPDGVGPDSELIQMLERDVVDRNP